MQKAIYFLSLFLISTATMAQNHIIPLWEGTPPLQEDMGFEEEVRQENIIRIANVQIPTIEVYLPNKSIATGQAVMIFPGGGYGILAYDWEGTDFAKWLNAQGIAGIVVKYRLPISKSLTDPKEVPLLDAQRAIRLTRAHAAEWNINPANVGIMGFSAGGHLASTLSTQYAHELDRSKDEIDLLDARPAFSILVYPVITFQEKYTHGGSKKSLLGENPSPELVDRFSNEKNVTEQTPPTFLVHAQDDTGVPIENSLLYYQALHQHGIPASLHIYPKGGHGFSFGLGKGPVENWRDVLLDWMKALESN
ncbi:alpha/beta hydrolase [Algoriphagus vanfongensis]|uniref:alpha/beta hydrolase n=1 Tax=Algoriphagus vanfongensis TaxID=426371 RepID=UPI0003FE2125|nr:alpha/beta hydrolase [Algoriphagus vanfongensis]